MVDSISKVAASLSSKALIAGKDAGRLVSLAEKDNKITASEARALSRVASLSDDRFQKGGEDGDVIPVSVDELRSSAAWSRELLGAKLVVDSTVPGLTVSFDKHVSVEDNGYGANYCRFLSLQMKGRTASRDGTLSFAYGGYKIKVPVKKGTTAEKIFLAVERKVLRQQNGAMSVRGGLTSERMMNPSVGFGIHRTLPMTPVERLESQKADLGIDLAELQMEGAPAALTRPILDEIVRLEAEIAKLRAKGG